jgi:hypothetical protein
MRVLTDFYPEDDQLQSKHVAAVSNAGILVM